MTAPRLRELLQQAQELAAQQAHVGRLQKGGVLIARQQPQIAAEEGGDLLGRVVTWRQRWLATMRALKLSEAQRVRGACAAAARAAGWRLCVPPSPGRSAHRASSAQAAPTLRSVGQHAVCACAMHP